MVTPELATVAKASGVADAVLGLSKALRAAGHKVTVALPKYPSALSGDLMLARRLTPLQLPSGEEAIVYDGKLPSGLDVVLLETPALSALAQGAHGDFAGAASLYGGTPGETGSDDAGAARFGGFCQAVVELVRQREAGVGGAPFEVVHTHDWPTAMVCYLLRPPSASAAPEGAERSRPRTVLTIHNVAQQGLFGAGALASLGLDASHFTPERLEFYGKASFLKGGILAADAVTTVSETYAAHVLRPEGGERLDGVLRACRRPLSGIVNGVDYATYNPATDPALRARYDAEDATQKARCKTSLTEELGLALAPGSALVSFVGRLVAAKGADVLASALPRLLREDVQITIVGEGDPAIEAVLRAAADKAPERVKLLGAAPEARVRRVLAASDLVLVPSRSEPCGLVQLYAQRYGALPVVARVGGLVDTVVDCDAALETGTGFVFDPGSVDALVGAVQRALTAFRSPAWAKLRRRVMRLDLGWERAARRYERIYQAS